MGDEASVDVTEDAYGSDADDDRDDNPDPALRLVLVVEAESLEYEEAAEDMEAPLLTRCCAVDLGPARKALKAAD